MSSWYRVQVLLRRWRAIDAQAVFDALRAWRGNVRFVSSTTSELVIEIPTELVPLRATIFHALPEEYAEELER